MRLTVALGIAGAIVAAGESVTFHKDVAPVLQARCQECHRAGEIGPMSLMSYAEARPWAKSIKAAVVSKKMPPWFADPATGHFQNDRSLSQKEIETLVAWADSGAPEGDAKDAPKPRTF
ncbi:MAG TPA: cytochrome c, partial [Bryobacteraceae bacterium]|nr:cytochrome c [Bryobacteraceae bacterium]